MSDVSKRYLLNREGVWYYRRIVPPKHRDALGMKAVFKSLGTGDLATAKKLRDIESVKIDAKIDAKIEAAQSTATPGSPAKKLVTLTHTHIERLARDYVQHDIKMYIENMLTDLTPEVIEDLIYNHHVDLIALDSILDPYRSNLVDDTLDRIIRLGGYESESVELGRVDEFDQA